MSMKHLIVTEPGFLPPNWSQGLEPVSILADERGAAQERARASEADLIWVLSSVPEWQQLVRTQSAHHPVIVLSKLTTLPEMQQALEAGARGYIEALANPVQLKQAADTVSQGALWIAAPMLSRLLGILSGALPAPQPGNEWMDQLSKREQQVAELVITGLSNRDVAEQLHISVRTVKEHLSSIFAKLDIQDRLQLILLARDGGQLRKD